MAELTPEQMEYLKARLHSAGVPEPQIGPGDPALVPIPSRQKGKKKNQAQDLMSFIKQRDAERQARLDSSVVWSPLISSGQGLMSPMKDYGVQYDPKTGQRLLPMGHDPKKLSPDDLEFLKLLASERGK